MKTLAFLFSKGSSFTLNVSDFTVKVLTAQLTAFQKQCLQDEIDHKTFAGSQTSFKLPMYEPHNIGIDNGQGIKVLRDNRARWANLKGYTILKKVIDIPSVPPVRDEEGNIITKGQSAKWHPELNPDYVRFIVAKIMNQVANSNLVLGELGELDNVIEHREAIKAAKAIANSPNPLTLGEAILLHNPVNELEPVS